MNNERHWDTVIEPKKGLFDIDLAGVWKYRDLVWLFVKRDFKAQYKQTILGPLWAVIQPIISALIFSVVFGKIAKIPTGELPHMLFYLSGMTIWNYFAGCLNGTSSTFTSNAGIFGKVYFPRLVMPLTTVISQLFRFLLQFLSVVGYMIYYKINGVEIMLTWQALWIFPIIFMAGWIGLASGIFISAFTTKYRDMLYLVGFGVQLLMYASAVIFPTSLAEEQADWIQYAIKFNPLVPLVEGFRHCLLGDIVYDPVNFLTPLIFGVVLLFIALVAFNRTEQTFMDTV